MSFDWKQYILLSDELINRQRVPALADACNRSAVSRAYYGVFCTARKLLIDKTGFFPREDIHKFVREEFNRAASRKEKQIGANLGRLWAERKNADYEEDEAFDNGRSSTAHGIAVKTIGLLDEIKRE
jgi:uncharacterized protein (UPF0332 family)